MSRRHIIELNRLQSLPHKWWKKNQDYQPAYNDVPIEINFRDLEWDNWSASAYISHIRALQNLTHIQDIVPTPWDYLYAINTEILEWKVAKLLDKNIRQSTPNSERADVAIFAALYIKVYFPEIDLYKELQTIEARQNTYFIIKPLMVGINHPTDRKILDDLLYMIAWGLCGGEVISKIEYNKRREDHADTHTT